MFSPISIDYSVISFKYYSIRIPKETSFSNYDQLFKTIFNIFKNSLISALV